MRPSDYPPPWSDAEAVVAPGDAEPIEVGVLVVGAGPAGLAAAIRLGQLIASDPETAAALGDVPVAVLEKGKAPGSHLLSGAVVDPGPLWRLLEAFRAPARPTGHLRAGARRAGPAAHKRSRGAAAGSPYDAKPRQRRRVRLAARAVPRRGGRGGRRCDPAGDGRDSHCSSRTSASSASGPGTRDAAAKARSSRGSSPAPTSARR